MTKWLSEQWTQIRGHVKYDLLKTAIVVGIGGSGALGALGALLLKASHGVNAEWFTFVSIFLCSVLVFLVALFGIGQNIWKKVEPPSNRLKIENVSETMKLGALWTVPTDFYFNLIIELRDIANENEVTIDVTSGAIQYAGANVRRVEERFGQGSGRFILPRISVAYGDDCVSHWDMGDSIFSGFYVYLIHANKFASEATIGVFAIDAYQPKSEQLKSQGAEN